MVKSKLNPNKILTYYEAELNPMQIKKLTPYLNDIKYPNPNKNDKNNPYRYLNLKQRAFAWYYVYNGNNKADAYRKAYMSKWNSRDKRLVYQGIKNKKVKMDEFTYNAVMAQTIYNHTYMNEAVKLIREKWEASIKVDIPQTLLEQLKIQCTYDPSIFINVDGSPKFKTWDEIPEEYRCCVEGIESKYHGRNADVKTTIIKLVDRDKARKYLMELAPNLFDPVQKIELTHATIDAEGKKIGLNDLNKLSTEELKKILNDVGWDEKKI